MSILGYSPDSMNPIDEKNNIQKLGYVNHFKPTPLQSSSTDIVLDRGYTGTVYVLPYTLGFYYYKGNKQKHTYQWINHVFFPCSISIHYNAATIGNTIHTVLQSLNWPYIQVVLQPTSYFRDVLSEFQKSRDSSYVCAIRVFEINSTSDNDVELLLTSLQYETDTKGILVLTDDIVLQ